VGLVHGDPVVRRDLEYAPLWAGESVELVHDIVPAGEVVRRIAAEADEALVRVGRWEG
jgi:hypothetical protein